MKSNDMRSRAPEKAEGFLGVSPLEYRIRQSGWRAAQLRQHLVGSLSLAVFIALLCMQGLYERLTTPVWLLAQRLNSALLVDAWAWSGDRFFWLALAAGCGGAVA